MPEHCDFFAMHFYGIFSMRNRCSLLRYFGNLHILVQQSSLEDLCSYFGQIDSAKVIKVRIGK